MKVNRLAAYILPSILMIGLFSLPTKAKQETPQIIQPPTLPHIELEPQPPRKPNISVVVPPFLTNEELPQQLRKWNQEAPDLTEVGEVGKTTQGKTIWYIRLTNTLDQSPKPKVLVTANIHGNEPLSGSTILGCIGTMLSQYGTDEKITELINTRDIYFVPILSPDSHPHSRHVDGVDPNRDFPTERNPNKHSVTPVQAIRDFFLQHNFNAVWSGHTFGRMYLTPWGDKTEHCPHHSEYQRIVGKMGNMSNYRVMRACELYNRPIYGTEVDWYYRHGAFAIVTEYGTHQRVPSNSDIRIEFDRTYKSLLHFVEEAPNVKIKTIWIPIPAKLLNASNFL